MSTDLRLPDPSSVAVAQVRDMLLPRARELRKEIEVRRDIPAAREMCRQLEAFRNYLRDREGRDLLAAECRRTEMLIGKLLGPAEVGSNQHDKPSPVGDGLDKVPREDRRKFRLLAEHEEVVEELLESGQVARNAILERIRRKADVVISPQADAVGRWVESLSELVENGERFGCIYADPPWQYANQGTRAATDNHYETMTLDAIAALPVGDLAADQSYLWLWTTNGFLFECPRLFAAWGFEFKSSYVWVKPQLGIGNYLRNAHELLLLAVRGGPYGDRARNVRSWGEFDRGRHSAKPDTIRTEVVEKLSPGPRLELFGRKYVRGWTTWGNQQSPELFQEERHE